MYVTRKVLAAIAATTIPIAEFNFSLWSVFWLIAIGQIMLATIEPLFCLIVSTISLNLVSSICLRKRVDQKQSVDVAGDVV